MATVTVDALLRALGISIGADELDGRWGVDADREFDPDGLAEFLKAQAE